MRGYSAFLGMVLALFAGAGVAWAQDDPEPEGPLPPAQARAARGEESRPGCSGIGCPPSEVAVARTLLASGPDTATLYDSFEHLDNKFAVVGFVRENWPVAVEYIAEPDTVTLLRIKLYHQRKVLIFPIPFYEVAFEQNLDQLPVETDTGDPLHRIVHIRAITLSAAADPAADSDPHVARFDIVSYRRDGNGILRENGSAVRAPVEIVGMAVGPRAVGSLTLRSGTLEDTVVKIPAANAPRPTLGYSYVTDDKRYDLLRVTYEQYLDSLLRWQFKGDVAQPHPGAAQTLYRGTWEVTHRRTPGNYRLSVSAWYACGGGTLSERLTECGDSPAWSVLHTGSFQLVR